MSFDVVDSTGGHHVRCYGLSSQRLYENLHDCVEERVRKISEALSSLKHKFICCGQQL